MVCLLCHLIEGATLHPRTHFAAGFMMAVEVMRDGLKLGPLCEACTEAMRVAEQDILTTGRVLEIESAETGLVEREGVGQA